MGEVSRGVLHALRSWALPSANHLRSNAQVTAPSSPRNTGMSVSDAVIGVLDGAGEAFPERRV